MLWKQKYEQYEASFFDIIAVHAVFSHRLYMSIRAAERSIENGDRFRYLDAEHDYREAIEMLGLHLFDCIPSRDDECKKQFPKWSEAAYREVPLFSSDFEYSDVGSMATGTEDEEPF